MPDLKPTVMPPDESKPNLLGSPGITVPNDASKIKEFSEIRNVDATSLNAKLQAEDEAKEKAETYAGRLNAAPGIVVPENAKDIKELSDIRDVDPKTLNK